MKLKRSQRLMLALIVLAVILAVTAAAVAFSGAGARARPLSTGSARLAGPELTDEALESLQGLASEYRADATFIPRIYLSFREDSARLILSGHGGENLVYSPVNLSIALAMAAETAGGSTRAQILEQFGVISPEPLREGSRYIQALCSDTREDSQAELASSVWLSNSVGYDQDTLDILASEHFADSFRGEPGTDGYNKLLQEWTNEKTHGILQESAEGLKLPDPMVMSLMSAVYFKASWSSPFTPYTCTKYFHSPDGDEECSFMYKTIYGSYYNGEIFTAATLPFSGGESMTFILPDDGVDMGSVLGDSSLFWGFLRDRYTNHEDGSRTSRRNISVTVPMSDVQSDNELSGVLKKMGITDAFDLMSANFAPLLNSHMPVYISRVDHAARVRIDENGCEAASYVQLSMDSGEAPGAAPIELCLGRPFIFLIQSRDGLPLFIGIVDRP